MILATHGIVGSQIVQATGLLAEYPGAAAAYSLRQLTTAYTGSAIRVRRASDNTEQNIGFVNNELDTSSLTSFCSGTNGFVTTWYDQSGNGRNATQTTAVNQPIIVSSGSLITENGKPAFYWNQNGAFDITPFDLSDQFTLFLLNGPNSATSRQVYLEFNSDTYQNTIAIRTNTGAELQAIINAGGNRTLQFLKAPDGNQILFYFTAESGVSASFGYNNINITSSVVGIFGNEPSPYIYKINSQRNDASKANSTYQELIIYSGSQSSNRTGIETNINSFYSIY
jgi:hypothetical protein